LPEVGATTPVFDGIVAQGARIALRGVGDSMSTLPAFFVL
jgi:hypothetical protein